MDTNYCTCTYIGLYHRHPSLPLWLYIQISLVYYSRQACYSFITYPIHYIKYNSVIKFYTFFHEAKPIYINLF